MKLKYIKQNTEKTFGNLEYAGDGKIEHSRVNGRNTIEENGFVRQ